MSRRMRIAVEAELMLNKAEEDTTCSMVLTFPDQPTCWVVIPARRKHVTLVGNPDDCVIHRYCPPCADQMFRRNRA